MARRARNFRERDDPLQRLHENEIIERYRFNRHGINFLLDLISDDLRHPTRRNMALSSTLQLLIALRFYASGSMQKVLCDTVYVSQPTVSRVVTRVTDALCLHSVDFISLQSDEECATDKQEFFNVAGFPGVIGLVDGTHIRIEKPNLHEEEYVNRKQYHSINVQLLVDSNSIIRNVVARWPGTTHDARVMRESDLCQLYDQHQPNGYVLGDSGYMLKPWLMTPYHRPQNQHQERYNRAHKITRSAVERTIGQLKKRFNVLHQEIRLSPAKVCRVVVACVTLHNIAKLINMPLIEDGVNRDDHDEDDDDDDNGNAGVQGVGAAVRNNIATTYF